jgi:hypothetical protein
MLPRPKLPLNTSLDRSGGGAFCIIFLAADLREFMSAGELRRSAFHLRPMVHPIISILFLTLAVVSLGLICSHAQSPTVTLDWEKVGVCQIRFLIPKDLKNQHAKGIDSCFAEFRSGKMRLAIDASGLGSGGGFTKHETMLDFVEESVVIDGKKVQIITYKDGRTKSKRKFVAGLFVVLYEAKPKETQTSAYLYMTVEGNNEEEIQIAKQIFLSIQFDAYKPSSITW